MIIKINPDNPQERLLRKAVEVLTGGGLIAYPTDTCYAVGCDLYNLKGINRIYQIKRRPLNKPALDLVNAVNTLEVIEVATDSVTGVRGIGDETTPGEHFHGLAQQALLGVVGVDLDNHC